MQEETHHGSPEATENHCEMYFFITYLCLSLSIPCFSSHIQIVSCFTHATSALLPPPSTSFVFTSPVVFSPWPLLCLHHLFTAILRISPAPPNLPDNATALPANSLTVGSYTHQMNTSTLFQLCISSPPSTPSHPWQLVPIWDNVSPSSQSHPLTSCSPSATQAPLPLSLHLLRAELEEPEMSPTTAEWNLLTHFQHIWNPSVMHHTLNATLPNPTCPAASISSVTREDCCTRTLEIPLKIKICQETQAGYGQLRRDISGLRSLAKLNEQTQSYLGTRNSKHCMLLFISEKFCFLKEENMTVSSFYSHVLDCKGLLYSNKLCHFVGE